MAMGERTFNVSDRRSGCCIAPRFCTLQAIASANFESGVKILSFALSFPLQQLAQLVLANSPLNPDIE